jgi:hypothetical protein
MSYFYSDPSRESDPHALPDAEVFYADAGDLDECFGLGDDDDEPSPAGWYAYACFPGCLPDGDPCGPFDSEAEAIEEWRSMYCD